MSAISLGLVDNILDTIEKGGDAKVDGKNDSEEVCKSRHFVNSFPDCISDCIDGAFISHSDNNVTRIFTKDKSIKVVYRVGFDGNKQAALISGGGSGHEPSHAGFVGKGMLTAAVCGEIFASPSTKSIVYAIKAVGGSKGVLLIVKNYTGDVLCFTLAAKIAKAKYNIDTQVIIIGDDCAIGREKAGRVGRRGIAGTVFIHKIAGYLAEKGVALNDIKTFLVKNVVGNLGSIGIAATSCYLPGSGMVKQQRIKTNELELGLGIHGEPGAMTIKFDKISNLIPKMFDILYDTNADRNYVDFLSKKSNEKQDIVVLINNLGGSTEIEMGIIMKYVIKEMYENKQYNLDIKRVFCGSYMTSLDMRGFSVSLLKVNQDILAALDYAVEPIAWIPGHRVDIKTLLHGGICIEEEKKGDNIVDNDIILSQDAANILRTFVENAFLAIKDKKEDLNALDAKVGDGDTGSTLHSGLTILMNKINTLNFRSLYCTLREIAEALADMGGSSGALYGYLFISAATRTKEEYEDSGANINGLNISNALVKAVQDLSEYGGANPGDRSMIDALFPAVKGVNEYYKNNNNANINEAIEIAAEQASEGAEATKAMKPKFGRSVYVPWEILKDVPDPGAVAVATWIQSFAQK